MAKAMQYPARPRHAAAEHAPQAHQAATVRSAAHHMVKIGPMVLIACLVLAILAVLMIPMVVGGTASVSSRAATASEAQILPSISYDSTQDAAAALGLPDEVLACLPEEAQVTAAAVVDDSYLELALIYGEDSFLYRAAAGSDDLSDVDYEQISYTAAEDLESTTIGYTGVSEKKLNSAVWVNGGYCYALVAENGVDAVAMKSLAEAMA